MEFRSYSRFFLLVVVWLFIVTHFGNSNAEEISTYADKSLSYSLLGLKESAQKLADENRQLEIQNKKLKDKISFLEKDLDVIDKKKAQLPQPEKIEQSREINTVPEDRSKLRLKIMELSTHIKRLDNAQMVLEEQFNSRQKQIDLAKNAALQLQAEVQRLKIQQEATMASFDVNAIDSEKIRIKGLIEQSQSNIQKSQDELRKLNQKYKRPEVSLGQFEAEFKSNKRALERNKEEIRAISDELNSQKDDLGNIQKENTQRILRVSEDIVNLRKKKIELESVLALAKTKMDGKKIQLAANDDKDNSEEINLKNSISLIEKENTDLKDQINSLEQTLNQINIKEGTN